MNALPASSAGDERRELVQGAAALQVSLSMQQAAALLRLLDELTVWNRTHNLTAITARPSMLRAHLLDSLSVLPELSGARIADVGTGAGFPGLPLALLCPERDFTLIDSVGKKIRFVTHAARILALANVTVLHTRVEALRPPAAFDTVVARAYAPLAQLLTSVQGLCGPGTRVLAMKGRYPDAELRAVPAGWRLERAREVYVPGLGAERHILRLVPDAPAARLATP